MATAATLRSPSSMVSSQRSALTTGAPGSKRLSRRTCGSIASASSTPRGRVAPKPRTKPSKLGVPPTYQPRVRLKRRSIFDLSVKSSRTRPDDAPARSSPAQSGSRSARVVEASARPIARSVALLPVPFSPRSTFQLRPLSVGASGSSTWRGTASTGIAKSTYSIAWKFLITTRLMAAVRGIDEGLAGRRASRLVGGGATWRASGSAPLATGSAARCLPRSMRADVGVLRDELGSWSSTSPRTTVRAVSSDAGASSWARASQPGASSSGDTSIHRWASTWRIAPTCGRPGSMDRGRQRLLRVDATRRPGDRLLARPDWRSRELRSRSRMVAGPSDASSPSQCAPRSAHASTRAVGQERQVPLRSVAARVEEQPAVESVGPEVVLRADRLEQLRRAWPEHREVVALEPATWGEARYQLAYQVASHQ